MLCFTQIYQISYPSHISLLSVLYSPSVRCPNFLDGPLPGPTGCTFPDRPDIPLPPLPGAPHPPVPSYSPMVVTISAKKVIALVALSAYYMVGLLISMRQNRKGGKLSGPYGIVSGKQGL